MAPRYLNQRFGDYQLVRLLGQGGFAEVYGALQVHLGTKAAVKILNDSFTEEQLVALREEARIVSQLGEHPHIVSLLTFSIERNIPYLVMSYAPGGSLNKLHPRGQIVPLPTVVTYVRQIAAALQYAHERRVVHRDIKPANFLMTQDGRVQVADFGIALMAQNSQSWTQQEIAGTWTYMAPEQFKGKTLPANDQYALAIVVYQWLSGQPPFSDEGNLINLPHHHANTPPPALLPRNPALPSEVEQVVFKALSKNPEERYPSIQEFSRALEEAATPRVQVQPNAGQRLGDYKLIRMLGSGSFAEVHEAQHIHLGTKAAIKILKGKLTSEQVETLRQEALTVITLDHPHIVRVHNFSVEHGMPYLVMAYASGGSLEAAHPQGQSLPLETILDYVRQIAGALQYAHDRHIVHRDIKPDNVLITQDGRVQIADFGIAIMAHTTQGHNIQQIVGTWHYMAPEQFEGKATPASDQYALAIMVYRWLLGELPFTGQGSIHTLPYQHLTMPPPSLREKVPSLSPAIEQVIFKALAKKPEERFATIQDFADALARAHNKPPLGTTLLTYEHQGGVAKTVAWSPDSTRIASGGDDATVRIWDATTGKTLLTLRGHTSHLLTIAWSKDGSLLASGGKDKTVHVWDTTSGRELYCYKDHTLSVLALAWSPDGTTLASSSEDKTVHVWEATTGRQIYCYQAHTMPVRGVVWSPTGRSIASVSDDKTVQVWEATTGLFLHRHEGHTASVQAIAWSPNGRYLASASADKTVQVWEAVTGRVIHYYRAHTECVRVVAWSCDGRTLASASDDKTVHIWEGITGRQIYCYQAHSEGVRTVSWSPDGCSLVSISKDMTIQVWEATTGRPRLHYESHADLVRTIAWSPNGRLLASASGDKKVQIWENNTGRLLQSYEHHTNAIHTVAWSPDGRLLASASADSTVQVWESTSGRLLHRYQVHTASVRAVAWSPDGRLLASASNDKTVHVWEATTGRFIHSYEKHPNVVKAVAWSPDGCLLASASSDKTVHVWDATTGGLVYQYDRHTGAVNAVAWSPDGQMLASASNDRTVQIWDAKTGRLVYRYEAHTATVNAVVWSPDGRSLASASADNTVHVWEATNGKPLFVYHGHYGTVDAVAWSSDGMLASAGYEVRIWQAT